jgi:hypothetical protein
MVSPTVAQALAPCGCVVVTKRAKKALKIRTGATASRPDLRNNLDRTALIGGFLSIYTDDRIRIT